LKPCRLHFEPRDQRVRRVSEIRSVSESGRSWIITALKAALNAMKAEVRIIKVVLDAHKAVLEPLPFRVVKGCT